MYCFNIDTRIYLREALRSHKNTDPHSFLLQTLFCWYFMLPFRQLGLQKFPEARETFLFAL